MIFTVMFKLQLELPIDVALVIAEVFPGDLGVQLPEKNGKSGRLELYCRSKKDALRRRMELGKYLPDGVFRSAPVFSIRRVKRRDWSEEWKKHFRVRRISKRLVVKPAWLAYAAKKNERVIEVEPGMSFGTGEHVTTRACLKLLDERQAVLARGSFLDVGCGSGILAIAAAKLGFVPVMAFDNDPLAVKAAQANFVRNNVAGRIACRQADVFRFRSKRKYSVIAANLFSNVLIRAADNLPGLLERRKRAGLILSGILARQYPQVAAAFRKRGLKEIKAVRNQDWVTALFEWRCRLASSIPR